MSGIVNSTGAVSGLIGTTVGTPGGGKILNVVIGESTQGNTKANSSSGTYTTAFTSPNITPSATSSDIIVMFHTMFGQSGTGNGNGYAAVKRDGSTLIGPAAFVAQHMGSVADVYLSSYGTACNLYDDAISTTSAVNYQLMVKDDGNDVLTVGGRYGDTGYNMGCWWTLLEVDGS